MNKIMLSLALAGLLTGCGYQGRDMESIGQVKTVMNNTPLICADFTDVDISLGVMRNGVGSMSTQDIWVVVSDKADIELLKKAQETGQLVKITYDMQRFPICTNGRWAKKIELVK